MIEALKQENKLTREQSWTIARRSIGNVAVMPGANCSTKSA
jgi:hypothetical protein